jgi:hypothetical protein
MRLVKESNGLDAERAFNSGLHRWRSLVTAVLPVNVPLSDSNIFRLAPLQQQCCPMNVPLLKGFQCAKVVPRSCGICFDDIPGLRAVRLKACGHLFCKGCIRELCSVQIKDGTVHLVKCPEV